MCVRLLALATMVGMAFCGLQKCTKRQHGISMRDQFFLKKACRAGHYEMQAARLALNTSQDKEVKAFAQVMLDEHKTAHRELKLLAEAKNIRLPMTCGVLQQDTLAELKQKEGAEFDALYAKHAVQAHEAAIELFETQAEKGSDDEVAGFAQDVLELLRQHLQHAHMLQRRFKSNDSTDSNDNTDAESTSDQSTESNRDKPVQNSNQSDAHQNKSAANSNQSTESNKDKPAANPNHSTTPNKDKPAEN